MGKAPHIHGMKSHPDKARLWGYSDAPPVGEWVGILEDRAWGTNRNLMLFFRHEETGAGFQLNVFNYRNYAPQENGPSFRHVELGARFLLTCAPAKSWHKQLARAVELDGEAALPSPATSPAAAVRVTVDLPAWVAEALLEMYVPDELAGPSLAERLKWLAVDAAEGLASHKERCKRAALYRRFGLRSPDDQDDDIDL